MKFTANDINKGNTWQIGTGDDTRMYHDIFIKYGVALVGPGDPGKEGDSNTKLYYNNNPQIKNWGATLKEIKKGEWIIARKGKQIILAVGQVLEEYNYSHLFWDIEGWDLQHYIKVKWYKPKTVNGVIEFSTKPLGQSTLQGCYNPVVFAEIYKIEFEEVKNDFEVEDFYLSKAINHIQIIDALIHEGVRIQDAENIGNTINRIVRLTDWYLINDFETLEAEIVAFLVTPLLIALGWSEQKIKIEYNYIDIALFNKSFNGDYSLTPQIIIEVKTFSNGLAFTDDQIKKYASKYPNCKKFITTNGFRYKYFEKMNNELVYMGYFNLIKLNERNIVYDIPISSIATLLKISNLS